MGFAFFWCRICQRDPYTRVKRVNLTVMLVQYYFHACKIRIECPFSVYFEGSVSLNGYGSPLSSPPTPTHRSPSKIFACFFNVVYAFWELKRAPSSIISPMFFPWICKPTQKSSNYWRGKLTPPVEKTLVLRRFHSKNNTKKHEWQTSVNLVFA